MCPEKSETGLISTILMVHVSSDFMSGRLDFSFQNLTKVTLELDVY